MSSIGLYFLEYTSAMALGYLAGRRLGWRAPARAFTAVVSLIIFLVAASSAPVIIGEAGYILGVSLVYALVLALTSALPLYAIDRARGPNAGVAVPSISAVAVSSLALGISVGYFIRAPYSAFVEPVLIALLFLAGLDLGAMGPLKLKPSLLITPLASLGASFAVGLAFYYALGINPAVAVGMGWYSFTGPYLLSASHDAVLASIGFLANFLREQATYILTPALARYMPPYAAIAMGGATTMDNTLPLYRAVYGSEYVVPAVINGVLLTILTPFIVPLVYLAFR
ncbi:MAG: lysine exporter LysO family protein [Thermoproteus sp. AZ2]|uniref:Lysine exporter LysO family protein n=1 Tax=Thermoproteus sp. AZ2 TaxID=1609232 RepID=A0ACC6V1X7_9CREN